MLFLFFEQHEKEIGAEIMEQTAEELEMHLLGADVSLQAVATDSRAMAPGSLFVALRGERFDAHDFVHEAAARGVTERSQM